VLFACVRVRPCACVRASVRACACVDMSERVRTIGVLGEAVVWRTGAVFLRQSRVLVQQHPQYYDVRPHARVMCRHRELSAFIAV
jgi:hypothetical protein